MPPSAPVEIDLPEVDIPMPYIEVSLRKKRTVAEAAAVPPHVAADYTRFAHHCGRCGRVFESETRSKLLCPECFATRKRGHWARSNRKRWRNGKPLPEGVTMANQCIRCGVRIGKRKRFCVTCRRVRQMDGDARRHRLKTAALRRSFDSESVDGEHFAPRLTQ